MNRTGKLIVTILSIVTVFAIIGGLYFHVLKGNSFFISTKVVEDTVPLEGTLQNLVVDVDFADLTVVSGKEFSVKYALPENMMPEISLKGGTLHVRTPDKLTVLPINAFSKHYITITIPNGSFLDRAEVVLDAGNLTLNSLTAENLNLQVDAGNISLEELKAGTIRVKMDAGNVKLDSSSAEELKVETDAGNLELSECAIGTIDAEVDAGNIEARDSSVKEGRCETDLGNITLSGDIGDVFTNASLGKISVED